MYDLSAPFTLLLGDLPTYVRLELTKLLHAEPDLRVVGAVAGVSELVSQARRLRPNLVIVAENQLRALEQLALHATVPALLYSPAAPLAGMLREASRWGLFDYIRPPEQRGTPAFEAFRRDLLRKIRSVQAPALPRLPEPRAGSAVLAPPARVVVIGGSTGGTTAVEGLLRSLRPLPDAAVVVAVHLPAHFTDSFVKRLRRVSTMPVVEGRPGTLLRPGTVTVACGGCHSVIQRVPGQPWLAWQLAATPEPAPTPDVPSIDLLMRSAARAFGRATTGVVLTGLGADGTHGARSIRQAGGQVVVQDEASAAVFSMPKSVISAGLAQAVLPLHELPGFLSRLAPVPLGSRPVSFHSQAVA